MVTPTARAKRVIALVDDLLFATRIAGTLDAHGYRVEIAADADQLIAIAHVERPDAVIVSFASPLLDWRGAIGIVRADPTLHTVPLLAFGPHVDTAARADAATLGADRVATNGAFFARMGTIVDALVGRTDDPAADEG